MTKAGLILAACLLTLPLTLAACKGDAKKDAGAGKAQGEVLPGSASDAMLPLDTVTSQPPLAPKSEGGEGGDSKAKSKPGTKPSDAVTESIPDEAPAASPAPASSSAPD